MTDTLKMAGFSLAAAMLLITLRPINKPFSAVVAAAAGTMLLFFAVTYLTSGVNLMTSLARQAGMRDASLKAVMKMIGMTYLIEFAVSVCRDAGEEGLADKVKMCGKAMLFAMTLPLLNDIASLALPLAP